VKESVQEDLKKVEYMKLLDDTEMNAEMRAKMV
jgi:hypothetical protein